MKKLDLLNDGLLQLTVLTGMLLFMFSEKALAQYKPDTIYHIYQFPKNMVPRIDGDTSDWAMVPESYIIGTDQLRDDEQIHSGIDRSSIDVRVKVGWVAGLNRLYFLYEAYDDYWDFARPDLHNDTYEVVVDGDLSGGPLIDQTHYKVWTADAVGESRAKIDKRIDLAEQHWSFHGVQAQNYHIFTPARGKDWAMAWGVQPWDKELPYANIAYNYNFEPGQSGKLIMEFYITPFDYAGAEGPQRSVESIMKENKLIGLSWAIIDYDDVNKEHNNGFWNLSNHHTMYGNASQLCLFRLDPLQEKFLKGIKAFWTFKVVDMDRRLVAFKDESKGKINSWHWDFGDGETSGERNPIHHYKEGGDYVVVLYVEGPEGKSRFSRVWDVSLK